MSASGLRSMTVSDVACAMPGANGAAAGAPMIERELREPLDRIVQTLHELSLHTTEHLRPTHDSPRLLHLARTLAGELRAVVDTLLGPAGDGVPGERRIRAETISVLAAFEDAAAGAGAPLTGRHVTVSCAPRLSVTTDAAHFEKLLSLLLLEAAHEPGEVHAVVEVEHGELVISLAGLRADASSGRSLDRIQSLAAQLGGRIDVIAHPVAAARVRVRLPQLRACDGANAPSFAEVCPAS